MQLNFNIRIWYLRLREPRIWIYTLHLDYVLNCMFLILFSPIFMGLSDLTSCNRTLRSRFQQLDSTSGKNDRQLLISWHQGLHQGVHIWAHNLPIISKRWGNIYYILWHSVRYNTVMVTRPRAVRHGSQTIQPKTIAGTRIHHVRWSCLGISAWVCWWPNNGGEKAVAMRSLGPSPGLHRWTFAQPLRFWGKVDPDVIRSPNINIECGFPVEGWIVLRLTNRMFANSCYFEHFIL